ncbi:hypothetical protein NDU88_004763, partial [Pleurodeles waltl]
EFLFLRFFPISFGFFPLVLLLEGLVCFGVFLSSSIVATRKGRPYLGLSRTIRRPGALSNPSVKGSLWNPYSVEKAPPHK